MDVLPLHPELAEMLNDWLKDAAANEPLFTNLEKKKTGKLIQKDLERAGIPYETKEGVADFHAAGPHTHVTELLLNWCFTDRDEGTGQTLRHSNHDGLHTSALMSMA